MEIPKFDEDNKNYGKIGLTVSWYGFSNTSIKVTQKKFLFVLYLSIHN